MPAHPLATRMLEAFGGAVAAPSANRFGRVSPTTAAHVFADLGDDVDLILDGGECPVGVESTIVDCTVEPAQLLRPGAITREQVKAILGDVAGASGPSRAAGMLASHYAPRCTVSLFESRQDAHSHLERLRSSGGRAVWFDATGDLAEAARTLYTALRNADLDGALEFVAVLPPPEGLGYAIRDRLTKAAAPRP